MEIDNLPEEDVNKLKHAINNGVRVKNEIKELRESSKETVDDVAKQLDIPKKKINAAINVAFKASEKDGVENVADEEKEEIDEITHMLRKVGHSN